jgi:hypothetical protein
MPGEDLPLLLTEAEALANFGLPGSLTPIRRLRPHQALDTLLQFRLPPGQTDGGGTVPQVVEDGAADMGPGEGGKGGLKFQAVELGGPDQAQQTHLEEIFTGFATAAGVVQRDGTDEIAVLLDTAIAPSDGRRLTD